MGNEYLTYLHDLFADFCPVTTRAMFGGHGVYRDGVIIGIVIDDTLYLKVDSETRAAFEAQGCSPFVYEAKGKSVPMSYWSVPEDALDSPQAFRPWAQRAWEAALRKPKSKKSAAKKMARKAKPKDEARH